MTFIIHSVVVQIVNFRGRLNTHTTAFFNFRKCDQFQEILEFISGYVCSSLSGLL